MGNCLACLLGDKAATYRVGGQALSKEEIALKEAAEATALVTGGLAHSSTVELHISCANLHKTDAMSESDPMAILYEKVNGQWKEVGRTEPQTNTHNPVFVRSFKVLYNFERVVEYRVLVVDVDNGQDHANVPVEECKALGSAEFLLSEVVATRTKTVTRELGSAAPGQGASLVIVQAEELSNARETLTITIAGSNLLDVEAIGSSDPFLEIHRQQGDSDTFVPVYKTEVKMNNLNPEWAPIVIKGTELNNGDAMKPLLIKVYDYEITGKHRLLGVVNTTAEKLKEAAEDGTTLALTNPERPDAECGELIIKGFTAMIYPSFLDYIQAGVEISFLVAVDFTSSNGEPTDPQSLHYLNPAGGLTKYEEAIMGVGKVLEFYDSDRAYPAFGFGGQKPPYVTNHCFHINGQPNPVCIGMEGICAAYRQALQVYKLSGPTLFAPVIKMACAIAQQPTAHLRYLVLLILTDGAIMDMEDTIDAIVLASRLPMSILIVGIGDADFSSMDALDADGKVLKSTLGRPAERDIVQFVPFSEYQNNGDLLAAQLLAELPGQFLEYVKARNIRPPPPRLEDAISAGTPRTPATPPH